MSLEEPEYDKWEEYKKLHAERVTDSLVEGYTSIIPSEGLPHVDPEWREPSGEEQEIDKMNLRVKREFVVGFQNTLEIKRRANFASAIYQHKRAVYRWVKNGLMPLIDRQVNRTQDEGDI